jgi:signal transduction histidine kinase
MTEVLIVEDGDAHAEALRSTLEGEGFLVRLASDGMTALSLLRDHSFDLIVSDVHLPRMDGIELCARVKTAPSTRETPVILLTSRGDPLSVVQGLEVGADNFLTKPFEPAQLLERVRNLLQNRSRGVLREHSVDVTFRGRRFVIQADKEQLLELLTSAFDELARSEHELRASSEELAQAKQRAELEGRYKSQFLAHMSHEFRTPLNAIIGFSELLSEESMGELNARQKEFVGYVLQGGRHLLTLINDVLDLSRVDAGRLQLSCDWLAPEQLIADVHQMIKPLAEKQEVELRLSQSEELPAIYADAARVKQILYNLLSNGIKFNQPRGRVSLDVSTDHETISWCVSDTGVGIRKEDLARLFRDFERIEQRGPKPDGTGLGLALTKRLVELHGGTIQVESLPGKGSTFTVRMPRKWSARGALAGSTS